MSPRNVELRSAQGKVLGQWFLQEETGYPLEPWYLDTLVARSGYVVGKDANWYVDSVLVARETPEEAAT